MHYHFLITELKKFNTEIGINQIQLKHQCYKLKMKQHMQ